MKHDVRNIGIKFNWVRAQQNAISCVDGETQYVNELRASDFPIDERRNRGIFWFDLISLNIYREM